MIWTPLLAAVPVAALTLHTLFNALLLRRPDPTPSTVTGPVSVLVPMRDEEHRLQPCIEALLGQRGVADLEIIVLDDCSTDDTAKLVWRLTAGDPRVRLLHGDGPPAGWLGKPYACAQLAAAAGGSTLVFVDADVVLAPTAVAQAVSLLRHFDLVSPYPRVVGAGRLVQPLLQWCWLTFLPLRAMERSRRPILSAAGGQFLAVRREAYERAGGHAAVRDRVLEDVELARAVKRAGGRITIADGSAIATARMYDSWQEVVAGYTKSLWAAFPSVPATIAACVALAALYVAPPVMAIGAVAVGAWAWAGAGLAGYLLGVMGRLVTGRATGGRVWPDALAHPASIAVLIWLLIASHRRHRHGRLVWKGRPVAP